MASLVLGESLESISRETVRASNARAKSLSGLVCVFVGGSGGIGQSTVTELFLHTTAPRAYIISRNAEAGNKLCQELVQSNEGSSATFLEADISLIKTVDQVCAELQRREKKINVLFLTAGYMTTGGRVETSEGLDHKMCVNYYGRMRFILNLMPQLTAAGEAGELSRALSVLGAGSEGELRLDDLDLKRNFTLHACLAHCVSMTDFMVEELAKRHRWTSFSHSYPGTVKAGLANELTGAMRLAIKVFYALMTPWILNVRESGERHLFQITSALYPSRSGSAGLPVPEGMQPVQGADGTRASGGYLLDWDGKPTGDPAIIQKHREQNAGPLIWQHTLGMYEHILSRKRRAEEEADQARREPPYDPNLARWRPG